MTGQAYLLAADDIFWASGWICIALIGMVWLCRQAKSGGGSGRRCGLIDSLPASHGSRTWAGGFVDSPVCCAAIMAGMAAFVLLVRAALLLGGNRPGRRGQIRREPDCPPWRPGLRPSRAGGGRRGAAAHVRFRADPSRYRPQMLFPVTAIVSGLAAIARGIAGTVTPRRRLLRPPSGDRHLHRRSGRGYGRHRQGDGAAEGRGAVLPALCRGHAFPGREAAAQGP